MLVTCQRFGDLFLFGRVWQLIFQFRQNIIKVGSKSWLLTCSSDITLSSPSYTGSALKIFVTAILGCCIFALYTQNIIFGILRIHNQIVTIPISTLSKSAQCHPCQSDRSHTLSIFAREVLITKLQEQVVACSLKC